MTVDVWVRYMVMCISDDIDLDARSQWVNKDKKSALHALSI